ncbi:MAG: hypothetical protein QXS20_00155 [Candidatus Thorarchaeota archaeon]
MQYQPHNKKLSARMDLLDRPSDDQLARELLQLHEVKCTECQENRLGCSVNPACHERNFLNLLIELGVDQRDLPAYCYSVFLDQLRLFITEGRGHRMVNRRVPIKDFLTILKMGSIKQFLSHFFTKWQRRARVEGSNILLVMVNDIIFHFDFSRGLVIVNPLRYRLDDLEEFRLYSQLFSEYYDVKFCIEDTALNWWILELSTDATRAAVTRRLDNEKMQQFTDIRFRVNNNSTYITVEVLVGESAPAVEVEAVKEVFEAVSSASGHSRKD